MDHLPRIVNPKFSLPKVPFSVQDEHLYDGKGVTGFAKRHGFKFEMGMPKEEPQSTSFFQAWLYFGTLIEFFDAFKIPIEYDDFICDVDGERFVTTKYLWDYVSAWVAESSRRFKRTLSYKSHIFRQFRMVTSENPSRRTEAISKAKRLYEVLDFVSETMQGLEAYRYTINSFVWDATIVLGSTLENVLTTALRAYSIEVDADRPRIFRSDQDAFSEVPSNLLTSVFYEERWCYKEQWAVKAIFQSDLPTLLSCLQLDREQGGDTHIECTGNICKAYQVDESVYRAKHVSSECACGYLNAGNVYDDPTISSKSSLPRATWSMPTVTIKKGKVNVSPVIPAAADINRVVSTLLPFEGTKFVAISHVWAQGLGNPSENALPQCQLDMLQSFCNELYPESSSPVPFYMDTMCIPLRPPESRKVGIKCMEVVYKSAPKALVIDQTLLCIEAAHRSPEEIALHIACSPWSRRLWTLQEGLFQDRVHYRFKDSFQSLSALVKSLEKLHAFPTRPLSIPSDHFLHDYLDRPPNCEKSTAPLAANAYLALSFWPRIEPFFDQMNINRSRWWEAFNTDSDFTEVIMSVMTRTTSRITDEGLVLASALRPNTLSLSKILDIDEAERYRKLFRPTIGVKSVVVPSRMIFLDQRRYDELGCRWIPRSLLSQQLGSENTVYMPRGGEVGWASFDGVRVWYPGVFIEIPDYDGQMASAFESEICGNRYRCELHEAGKEVDHSKNATMEVQHPAIIIQRDLIKKKLSSRAVLVDIEQYDWVRSRVYEEHETPSRY